MKQTFLYHDVFDDQFYQIIKKEITSYAEIIDKLQWLIDNIKQDIIYVINKLSQFMKNSIFIHVQTIKRMIRYFKEIMLLNKRFESFESHDDIFYEYIDFVYDDNEFTRRFHSNYAFLFWNDVISHVFKRQDTISISSTKTEYVDQCNVVKKIYFLKQIFNELNEKFIDFMKIRADNQSIITLINNFNNHKRIKYIFIQYHYVRKLMKNKQINFIYFFIVDMLIDDLIKSLKR